MGVASHRFRRPVPASRSNRTDLENAGDTRGLEST